MAAPKSFGQRVLANLKKRWTQVFLCVLAFCVGLLVTQRVLGPKAEAKNAPKDPNVYKFLRCSECKLEMPYNPEQADRNCPKCRPPKVGFLTPAKESVKTGGDRNPWQRYNIAVIVEGVLLLAAVYYFLSRPVEAVPTEFVLTCPHCGTGLQYTPAGFDQYALCGGCEQVIKLPDEDEAMTREDQQLVKENNLLTVMEADLRQSGHIVDPAAEGVEQPENPPPAGA